MNYFLIAGEASGDLHASALMEAIKQQDADAQFRYFGGDLMAAQGGELVKHYREMAFMGFLPVLLNLNKVLANIAACKAELLAYQPDVVILVDYPGFNLKIAKFLKEKAPHIPVYYYISPKIWAWKEYRIGAIKRYIDRMFSILPFEVPFYAGHNYPIDYVGNPTVDEIAARHYATESFAQFTTAMELGSKPIIALLAGSRRKEIATNLPLMLEAAAAYPHFQLVVAGAPGIEPEFYNTWLKNSPAQLRFGVTYRLLHQSQAALVTSGTATLETALLKVPQVVCYKSSGGALLYHLMRRVLKVEFVSLVNLVANRGVVTELLLHQCTVERIRQELEPLLSDTPQRIAMLKGYQEVATALGEAGAPQHAAAKIAHYLPLDKERKRR